jgi:hypothetical protein
MACGHAASDVLPIQPSGPALGPTFAYFEAFARHDPKYFFPPNRLNFLSRRIRRNRRERNLMAHGGKGAVSPAAMLHNQCEIWVEARRGRLSPGNIRRPLASISHRPITNN